MTSELTALTGCVTAQPQEAAYHSHEGGSADGGQLIKAIPDDCWERVLAFLYSKGGMQAASLVSRGWHRMQARLRTRLSFVLDPNVLQTSQTLQQRHANVEIQVDQAVHTWHARFLSFHVQQEWPIHVWDSLAGTPRPNVSFLPQRYIGSDCFMHLTTLRLIGCAGIDDLFMARMAAAAAKGHLHALTTLSIKDSMPGISDEGLKHMSLASPAWRSLDLRFSDDVIDRHFLHMTENGIETLLHRHGAHLHELHLKDVSHFSGRGVRQGRVLTTLTAEGSDLTLEGLQEGCSGTPLLRSLDLSLPFSLDEPRMSSLVGLCPLLEELNLFGTDSVDDREMAAIAGGWPRLRVLCVSCCENVGLQGWKAVAATSALLQELDVSQCVQFGVESLEAIQRGCPQLRVLRLDLLDAVYWNEQAMGRFLEARPGVEVDVILWHDYY